MWQLKDGPKRFTDLQGLCGKEVGGGLIAQVKDANGNVVGLRQETK